MLATFLFIFGLAFGSFSSVVIYRIRHRKSGILTGRSVCPKCDTQLTWADLVPVFSWLYTGGKCRHCRAPISPFYPILELSMATTFAVSGSVFASYLDLTTAPGIALLGLFLMLLFVTVVYTAYDILYFEIPDEVVTPMIALVFFWLIGASFWPQFSPILFTTSDWPAWIDGVVGACVMYGFFFLQVLVPGGMFFYQKKNYKFLGLLLIEGIVFPFWTVLRGIVGESRASRWMRFDAHETEDIPVWIGGGDLRLAILIGLFGGFQLALCSLLLAYLVGALFSVGILLKHRQRGIHIPFGPFLAIGFLCSYFVLPLVDAHGYLFFL